MSIASTHADVMHWFPKHGKSMDTFRSDVKALLNEGTKVEEKGDAGDERTDLTDASDLLAAQHGRP